MERIPITQLQRLLTFASFVCKYDLLRLYFTELHLQYERIQQIIVECPLEPEKVLWNWLLTALLPSHTLSKPTSFSSCCPKTIYVLLFLLF